jgi:thymidine kinase
MEFLKIKSEEAGYLKVILGPMFSGKTSELIRIYRRYMGADVKNCCVINHIIDTRYDSEKMSSHNKDMINSFNYTNLKDCLTHVTDYSVFLINEGQFFPDLIETVHILVNMHKKSVYVCGLDGDFKRNEFGKDSNTSNILQLIPNCDDVVKLKAICKKCKKRDAIFTHRLSNESQQTVVGIDNYTSYCRHCYNLVNAFSPPSKPNIKHLKN